MDRLLKDNECQQVRSIYRKGVVKFNIAIDSVPWSHTSTCGRRQNMWKEAKHVEGGKTCGRRQNMWKEAKHVVSIPDNVLNIDDNDDMLYTGYYATYDFETMLHKENVLDVEW